MTVVFVSRSAPLILRQEREKRRRFQVEGQLDELKNSWKNIWNLFIRNNGNLLAKLRQYEMKQSTA